jgi:hypothetical protein
VLSKFGMNIAVDIKNPIEQRAMVFHASFMNREDSLI